MLFLQIKVGDFVLWRIKQAEAGSDSKIMPVYNYSVFNSNIGSLQCGCIVEQGLIIDTITSWNNDQMTVSCCWLLKDYQPGAEELSIKSSNLMTYSHVYDLMLTKW